MSTMIRRPRPWDSVLTVSTVAEFRQRVGRSSISASVQSLTRFIRSILASLLFRAPGLCKWNTAQSADLNNSHKATRLTLDVRDFNVLAFILCTWISSARGSQILTRKHFQAISLSAHV